MVFNSITKKYRLLKISIIMYLWMQSLLFRISRNNSFTFTSLNCSAIFSDRVNVCKSSSVQVLNNVIRLVILFFFSVQAVYGNVNILQFWNSRRTEATKIYKPLRYTFQITQLQLYMHFILKLSNPNSSKNICMDCNNAAQIS